MHLFCLLNSKPAFLHQDAERDINLEKDEEDPTLLIWEDKRPAQLDLSDAEDDSERDTEDADSGNEQGTET